MRVSMKSSGGKERTDQEPVARSERTEIEGEKFFGLVGGGKKKRRRRSKKRRM